jgi:hypothetical protein
MTYQNTKLIQHEADTLRRVLEAESIPYSKLGGRQHYLRWQMPQTARNWEAAGMHYDSTLSYADNSGFRCGTSHEYPMFDAEVAKSLLLRQRPLLMMDSSVVADSYMGMGYTDEALTYMRTLKQRALSVGGVSTLLWHNSDFQNAVAQRFYKELI